MILGFPWQDFAIMIGAFILAGALIPTICNKHKPEPATSATTASILVVFVIALATLGLWLSAIGQALCVVAWIVLFVQVLRRKRKRFEKIGDENTTSEREDTKRIPGIGGRAR